LDVEFASSGLVRSARRSDTPKQFQANHTAASGACCHANYLRHFFLRDWPPQGPVDLLLALSAWRFGDQVEPSGMKDELAGSRPKPLVRLLAERATLGWLETHYLDTVAAQNPGLSGPRLTELTRRRDAAHRRYLAALTSLALVRRLLLGESSAERGRKRSRKHTK
jgi:hypothetical protein